MDNQHFDAFLDDATHKVSNMWERQSGSKLSTDEKYELNDVLTAFFGQRREEDNDV